jgi:EAL domain-containing protein (putative c-di-GMP-specific phosphodiesterase class I)
MHKARLERQQRVQDERQKALIKEQQRQKAEQEKRIAEKKEQQRLIAEQKRKAEQERLRLAELERLRQEEQRRQEEKRHKEEEERLRQAELERQRREEEERIDAEEERLRLAEPERQRQKELSIQKEKQANIDILAFPLEIETYPEESEKPDSKTENAIEITEVSKEEAAGPEAELDESSLNLKRAFNDNRIIQTFQPVVAMFSPESGVASTIYKIDIQLVDMAGTVKSAREINRQNTSLSLQQDIDRWMLREIIGGVVRSKNFRSGKIYLLAISEAWLTDTTLFAWLKKLLTGVENIKPGKLIALEIPAGLLLTHKKRALALIRILKNSHGFRIALGSINTLEELTSLSGLLDFNLLTIRYKLTEEIRNNPGYNGDINFLQTLKSHGTRVIIDGIEDSTMLTDAISLGADYVMGIFIGEPQSSLAGTGNVESFDISY